MSGLPIWEDREGWSIAPPGYVPLFDAMQEFGRAKFGDTWTGRELSVWGLLAPPPRTNGFVLTLPINRLQPAEIPEGAEETILASAGRVKVRPDKVSDTGYRLERRQRGLLSAFLRLLVSGRLEAAADNVDGGLDDLTPAWWRTNNGRVALIAGRAHPIFPPRWVFVTAKSLETTVAEIRGTEKSAAAQADTQQQEADPPSPSLSPEPLALSRAAVEQKPAREKGLLLRPSWHPKPGEPIARWSGRLDVVEEAKRRLAERLTKKISMNGVFFEMAKDAGASWTQGSIANAQHRVKGSSI